MPYNRITMGYEHTTTLRDRRKVIQQLGDLASREGGIKGIVISLHCLERKESHQHLTRRVFAKGNIEKHEGNQK